MAEVPVSPSDSIGDDWYPESRPKPGLTPAHPVWGPWASAGWTLLIELAFVATQLGAAIGYVVARKLADPRADLSNLSSNGTFIACATILTVPVILSLVWFLIWVRGWSARTYLGLRPASVRALILATSGLIIGLATTDGLTFVLDRPIVPPFMADALDTAPLWLLALAVVVAAPITEEVLFRGFLYRGLAESRLGPGMAIGITAIAWACLHIQYDLFGVAIIYLTGLYLGAVRYYSGSLTLTIFLHGVANTVATAEAVFLAG